MKFPHLLIGLLAGTALGGSVVAATGIGAQAKPQDAESIKVIVREVIAQEPQLILDSVQKYQTEQMKKQQESNNERLKDPAVREQVFGEQDSAYVGPKDAKKIVVKFFDYDCPACKMMVKSINELVEADKDVKIVFREYPIFGATSDMNSKIGLAVWRIAPEKYLPFYTKMMEVSGQKLTEEKTLGIVKSLGLNVEKVKAEAAKKEVADVIAANHALGEKLGIRGTPALVIGDEIIPHAMSKEELEAKVSASSAQQPDKKSSE